MSFPILGSPKPAFFDSSGSPLASGTLAVLDPADDTNKASYPTYDDAEAATNANVNPVVLDARGEPPNGLWGLDDEDYKLVLKDVSGATIWTSDDVFLPHQSQYYDISGNEVEADITDYSKVPGDVERYHTGGEAADISAAFQLALDSGFKAYLRKPTTKWFWATPLVIPPGGGFSCETRDSLLSYTGTAGTYAFTCTLATMSGGACATNFTLEAGTAGVNGFKFIECRSVFMDNFSIVSDSGGNDFAIGILFDDDAGLPQVGSSWNNLGDDFYIENCTDTGIRLDTQGVLVWCNRNTIGEGHVFNCATGVDLVRADTNKIYACPQNCTVGYALSANANYNTIDTIEEACTTSLSINASAVRNQIRGHLTAGTLTGSGSNTIWLLNDRVGFEQYTNDTITFDPQSGGNVTYQMQAGETGNMNFAVRDSGDVFDIVMSLVANIAQPYALFQAIEASSFLRVPSYTTAQLSDVTNAVNTSDSKKSGVVVLDTTASVLMVATGSADASTWVGYTDVAAITLTPS